MTSLFTFWISSRANCKLISVWAVIWQNQQSECAPSLIRPVWSESSLSAWWKLESLATHCRPLQTYTMVRLSGFPSSLFAIRMMKAWVLSYPLPSTSNLYDGSSLRREKDHLNLWLWGVHVWWCVLWWLIKPICALNCLLQIEQVNSENDDSDDERLTLALRSLCFRFCFADSLCFIP